MKHLLIVLVLLLPLAGCAEPPTQPAPAPPVAPVPAVKTKLLYFTQKVCPACRVLEREMQLPPVQQELVHFEMETVHYPDKRFEQYGVKQTPFLIVVTATATHKYFGHTPTELAAWLHDVRQDVQLLAIEKIIEGGTTSPDGKVTVVCDLPASERKKNIASKGLGCCVFRSIEYAARWQQVPELFDLPEQMVKAGIPGGGYPQKVDDIIHRFGPNAQYINDSSGDPAILEAILASGRMPCVTYNGHDCHYSGTIAHMVCLPYFNRQTGWACVSDNNFIGPTQFVWMTCDEFLQRWKGGGGSGWVVALLAAPPPPPPHSK